MGLDDKLVSISSKYDYTQKCNFEHGLEFNYYMSKEEEYALNLISRLEGANFCPYIPLNNSIQVFEAFNYCKMFREFALALDLSSKSNWMLDDKTYDDFCLVVPIHIGNTDIYNTISDFYGDIDEQDITSLHYSFFINSFFEHFNQREDSFKYNILFSDLKEYRKKALKEEDSELLDYLSQRKLCGISPTRLIGDKKYWNL